MEKLIFNTVDFIRKECNSMRVAGHIHSVLPQYEILHGTDVFPSKEEQEGDDLISRATKYFVSEDEQESYNLIRPVFGEKVKELSEKLSETNLFRDCVTFYFVVYYHGFGLFDKDYNSLGFVCSQKDNPTLPEIVKGLAIKGSAWKKYHDDVVALLDYDPFFEEVYESWDNYYGDKNAGKLS